MSHVQNYDIRLMSVVSVFSGNGGLTGDLFMRATWWGSRGRGDKKIKEWEQYLLLLV